MVSEIAIRRKLKKSGAITSYNKNGRFYTLPHIPKFDSYGLWCHNDIRFSKYVNLNQIIIQLISLFSSGLHTEVIGELIAYPLHSLLYQLCIKSAIQMEKLHERCVCFSIDEQLYKSQLNKCTSLHNGDPLAITSDMGRAFLSAILEVFPDKPNYICHFHFLRDIEKDLLEKEYSIIRNKL